jgi:hypothetical protein
MWYDEFFSPDLFAVGEFDNYAISRDKVMEPVRAPSGQTQG